MLARGAWSAVRCVARGHTALPGRPGGWLGRIAHRANARLCAWPMAMLDGATAPLLPSGGVDPDWKTARVLSDRHAARHEALARYSNILQVLADVEVDAQCFAASAGIRRPPGRQSARGMGRGGGAMAPRAERPRSCRQLPPSADASHPAVHDRPKAPAAREISWLAACRRRGVEAVGTAARRGLLTRSCHWPWATRPARTALGHVLGGWRCFLCACCLQQCATLCVRGGEVPILATAARFAAASALSQACRVGHLPGLPATPSRASWAQPSIRRCAPRPLRIAELRVAQL